MSISTRGVPQTYTFLLYFLPKISILFTNNIQVLTNFISIKCSITKGGLYWDVDF